MTKSNLQEALIDYTIDMCSANIRVTGIIAILEGLDLVGIAKMISKTKVNNYMAVLELMDKYEYSADQRTIVFTTLENGSEVAAMKVKHYYDNYRRNK